MNRFPVSLPLLRVSSRPASARRRLALAMAACSLFTLEPCLAQSQSLPTGLTVAAGQAQVSMQGNSMTVRNSPNAILNWNSFSIGAQNAVRFDQVNAASKVLNRVTGSDPSQILGQLSSNGQVWLLNPNGVLFGAGARVDVASLVTSTLALQDRDWLAGRFNFTAASASSQSAAADVVNQGEIRSALGGRVLLLGGNVRNEGVIDAAGGQVLLAAGQSIELVDTGAPNLTVKLTAPSGEALNLGTLSAAGGRIDVHAALVNQQGIVRADSLSAGPGGEIVLQAGERLNLAAGSVTSASAVNGDGGRVKLLGREVGLFGSALVAASGGGAGNGGEVLVGGGQQGKDASVPNAQAVYFGRDALIRADAGTLGNGGRIILWSDAATRAFGSLSAQGGAQGGDGGFIETSGGWLDARPLSLNLAAPNGRIGQWLLDPYDIIISDGQTESGFGPGNFTANADNARIDSSTLINALNQGVNVTVSTSATGVEGTQAGGITVTGANILVTAAAPGSLTLIADADIDIFDSVIRSSSGAMPVSLLAARGSLGSVRILESTIETAGGRLLIGGFGTGLGPDGVVFANATRGGSSITSFGVELGQNTVLNAGSGTIEINAANDGDTALHIDTGAQLRAANMLLRGSSSSDSGVSIDNATLTATHSLTVQGRGSYQGVSTSDGAVLEVAPPAIDTTAALTVTGLSEGADSGVGLSSFSSQPSKQLIVSNGATLTVSGANQPGEGPAVSVNGAYYSVGPLLYSGSNGGLITVNVFGDGDAISFSDAGIGTLGAGINVVSGGQLYLNNAPITAGGKIDLRAAEITLDSGTLVSSSATAGGDAIVLRGLNGPLSQFYNRAGAGALQASGLGQRWIVYATDLFSTNNFQAGSLAYDFKRYGAATAAAWVNDAGNGFVTSIPQTATFTATASNKVYDGNAIAAVSNGSARGSGVSTDIGSLSSNSLPAFDSKNVGTAKPITFQAAEPFNFVDSSSKPVYGYTLVGSLAANITQAPLSGLVTATNKVYDATRSATVNVSNLSGLVAGETIVVSATGQFADKNVGTGKTVTTEYQLSNGAGGDLASNYRFIAPSASPTANITPLALTATGLSAGNKVYDATTGVTLSGTAAVTALAGDQLSLLGAAAGSFADKNVGTAKAVVVQGLTLSGSDVGNYTLNPLTLRADITPATLNLVGVSANGKVYDATTVASLSGTAALSAALGSDQVALGGSGTAAFLDKNVGTAKPVQLSGFGLTGADAGNYLLNTALGLSANITPAQVQLGGLSALDKVYDATTRATLGGTAAVTPLTGDQLSVAGSAAASFGDKNVGKDKSVRVQGLTLAGADAGNYLLTVPTLLADITPASLSVTGLTANNKVYDTGTVATLTGMAALATVLGGDQVSISGSGVASFADKNVGTGKSVAVQGLSLAGADAGNYMLVGPSLLADITPASLSVTGLAANNKVYDAGTVASLTGTAALATVLGGDQVSISGSGVASFADKNVGNGKSVAVQGLTLAGADAGNYTLAVPSLLASITPAPIAITGLSANNKVYDAGTAAALTGTASLAMVLGSDQVTLTGSGGASFADKNVGTAKPVTVNGYGLAGADASNYQLAAPTGLNASITPATLTYTADPAVRTAGGSFGTFTGAVSGFVGAETLPTATTGTANFTTPADGSSPASLYAINGSGLAAQNYVFVQALGNARALELTGLPAELPQNGGSDVAVNTALVNLSTIRISSEPAAGGLADLTPTTRLASSAGRADFGSVSLASMSPQALQNMLDARDRYKKTLFAESISKLEQDPGLADLQPCTSMQEAAVGTCMVTEQLKAKLQDSSGTGLAQAPTPLPPAAAPATPTPQPVPAAPAVAIAAAPAAAVAAPPSSWITAKRKVRSASLPAIERKVALVIGVDNYADPGIPKLGNAVRDAEAIGQVFETTLGYETVVLANARKADVVAALNGLALELNPRDSVMIYYAGHGELIEATQLGYWQLADSDAKKPESWLSNADISRLVSRIGASQVALISDSCYSGSLVNEARIRATPGKVDPAELLQHKSVVVMSSGGNEPVFDNGKQGHSPFAWNLMNTLQKVSSWQAGGQVFERVRFAVARELPQRPQYGASSVAGHQPGGDYLFEQRQLEARN